MRKILATMAVLVWMMLLAVSAAAIAFVLSSRPRILAPLVGVSSRPCEDSTLLMSFRRRAPSAPRLRRRPCR